MKKINIIIALIIIVTIISSLRTRNNIDETIPKKEITNKNQKNIQTLEEKIKNNDESKITFEKNKLYSLINSYRKSYKLNKLEINRSLEISAKRKIEDMISKNYFRHQDDKNIESWYLFKISGYEFKTAGENLSFGINTPWQVFSAWKNSEKHNDEILNKTFLDMGIATDCNTYKTKKNKPSCIVVLHLGSR